MRGYNENLTRITALRLTVEIKDSDSVVEKMGVTGTPGVLQAYRKVEFHGCHSREGPGDTE